MTNLNRMLVTIMETTNHSVLCRASNYPFVRGIFRLELWCGGCRISLRSEEMPPLRHFESNDFHLENYTKFINH